MNRDLMLSILAMDSYNRGYGEGVLLPTPLFDSNGDAITTVNIGNARISSDSSRLGGPPNSRIDFTAGFYAIAYNWNGETVISYRGTDNPFGLIPGAGGSDVNYGDSLLNSPIPPVYRS